MRARTRLLGIFAVAAIVSLSLIAFTQNPTSEPSEANDREAEVALVQDARAVTEKPEAWSSNTDQDHYVCIGQSNSPVVQKIEKALRTPLPSPGLKYVELPLNVVVKDLQKRFEIPIVLDKPALETAGLLEDEPTTVDVRGIALKSALRQLLRNLALTYLIDDEMLIITTPEEAERRRFICVFDVRDLLNAQSGRSLDLLVETLKDATSDTQSFGCNYNGCDFSIRAVPPGILVVTVDPSTRDTLRDLLAAIREMDRERTPAVAQRQMPATNPDIAADATK